MSAGIFARVIAPQEFALGLSQLGTDGSNPSPTSAESAANFVFGREAWKKGGGRSQISDAPPSPHSSNLRVGPQLPLHIVTAGPEDDASGAAGLELGETFAQLLAS